MHIQVENLALEKWGGQEKLDAERAKRHEKRLDRERAKAGMRKHMLLQALDVFSEADALALTGKRISALGWPASLACCDNLGTGERVLCVVMSRPDNCK